MDDAPELAIDKKPTRNTIIISLLWKFLERGSTQGIQFVVSIILARLLLPKDYGVIALITFFIAIANSFIQTGFNTALIQNKRADELDFSSALYMSLIVAVILYLILFFCAIPISRFYNEPLLTPIIRVFSSMLILGAINSIQMAIIARRMEFRKYFISSLSGVIISGGVGITMAYHGFGPWALVAQQMINLIIVTVVLMVVLKWHPRLIFSINRVVRLFSFGWKLLCSSLIDTIYQNIYGLVIGKKYSSEMLGYYNRGYQFPSAIIGVVNGSIQSVMLPVLSANQEDLLAVKGYMRRSIMVSSYLVFPLMFGMVAIAKPFISILLTDKWLPSTFFMILSCISFSMYPIHTINLSAINAIGRSDIFLKVEIVKKILAILVLIITIPFGISVMAIGQVFTSFVAAFINAFPNRQLLKYSYKEQFMDIIPSLALSSFMATLVYFFEYFNLPNIIIISLQILFGIFIYWIGSSLLKFKSYHYLLVILKDVIKGRRMI